MPNFPFQQAFLDDHTFVRTFRHDVDDEEMVWHRDRKKRKVQVLESKGWFFQRDGELPVPMNVGDSFTIPAKSWHRAIRRLGASDLIVKITEFEEGA